MPAYLVLRILLFIPSLFGILLISFFLSRQVPGDPVAQLMGESLENPKTDGSPFKYYREYELAAAKIDRDIPPFYFSLAPSYLPEDYFSEPHKRFKRWYAELARQYAPSASVNAFVRAYHRAGRGCWNDLTDDQRATLLALEGMTDKREMEARLNSLSHSCNDIGQLLFELKDWRDRTNEYALPGIYWWGGNNAFHRWINGLLRFDFGLSLKDGRPATQRVESALIWTVLMNAIALIGLLGIGLPLGVWLAVSKHKKRTAVVSSLLYAGYAVPSFWLATMLLVFFSTTEWGRSMGAWMLRSPLLMAEETQWGDRLRVLILPALSIVLPSLAFVSRQMEQSVRRELGKLYVTTARAKGLSRARIIWNHVVPNALFPVITWLATLIPALLAGSVVIEVIFNIPGMGRLMWESIFGRDWPVVFTVLVLTSCLALAGQLLADILYAFLDPRVQFGTKISGDGTE